MSRCPRAACVSAIVFTYNLSHDTCSSARARVCKCNPNGMSPWTRLAKSRVKYIHTRTYTHSHRPTELHADLCAYANLSRARSRVVSVWRLPGIYAGCSRMCEEYVCVRARACLRVRALRPEFSGIVCDMTHTHTLARART